MEPGFFRLCGTGLGACVFRKETLRFYDPIDGCRKSEAVSNLNAALCPILLTPEATAPPERLFRSLQRFAPIAFLPRSLTGQNRHWWALSPGLPYRASVFHNKYTLSLFPLSTPSEHLMSPRPQKFENSFCNAPQPFAILVRPLPKNFGKLLLFYLQFGKITLRHI